MREILTQEEKEKKQKRNRIIIGIILIAIMALSSAGYAFFSGSPEQQGKIKENGVEFILNENDLWQFEINRVMFLTQFNPKETSNISAPLFVSVNDYAGYPLFFIGNNEAKQEIARNFGFVLRMQEACIEEKECEGNLPVKNCSVDNVIIIKESKDIKMNQEDKCIFIEAPKEELIRAADAFIFKVLGVKNE